MFHSTWPGSKVLTLHEYGMRITIAVWQSLSLLNSMKIGTPSATAERCFVVPPSFLTKLPNGGGAIVGTGPFTRLWIVIPQTNLIWVNEKLDSFHWAICIKFRLESLFTYSRLLRLCFLAFWTSRKDSLILALGPHLSAERSLLCKHCQWILLFSLS